MTPGTDELEPPSAKWITELLDAIGVSPSVIFEPDPPENLIGIAEFPTARRLSLSDDTKPSFSPNTTGNVQDSSSAVFVNCIVEEKQQDAWWACDAILSQGPGALPDYWVHTGRGAAAQVLKAVVELCSRGQLLAALVPLQVFRSSHTAALRTWLAEEHGIEWLVFINPAASVIPVRHQLEIALLVIRVGVGPQPLLRLVELSECGSDIWRQEISAALTRGGGETNRSIVLRKPDLGAEAWTYKRFTREFREIVDDARGLGPLCKLSELVHDFTRGLHRARIKELEVQHDLFTAEAGGVQCFSGSSIGAGEFGAPSCWVKSADIPEGMELKEGDCLMRSIMRMIPGQASVRAALVRAADLPATFDHSLIRLRPSSTVTPPMMELIVSFLNSRHFSDMLVAHGADSTLSIERLKHLEVPLPSAEVMTALARLSASETKYRSWAEQCKQTRASVHLAKSYSVAVERLISQEQLDFERVRAAEESQTFEYQVRNYYPYPIALRRERIQQLENARERLDQVFLCAEHVMNLLALASMVQIAGNTELGERITSKAMQSFVVNDALLMDWGKAEAVLREGLVHTSRAEESLSLPFPALMRLTEASDDSFFPAERRLRNLRNSTRHLQEIPPFELETTSRQATQDLDLVIEALGSLVVTPLVAIDDYQMDPTTRERHAKFRLLRGLNQAFRVERKPVEAEVPRGAVGFLDHAGLFRNLSPWLVMKSCPTCQKEELFLFNRYQKGTAKYIAMESGHASISNEVAHVFEGLISD